MESGGRGVPPPRAIFAFGVPRSGTTLLVRLLDGHPRLLVLPRESHAGDWHRAPSPALAFRERRRKDGAFFPDPDRTGALIAFLGERLPGPAGLREALLAIVEGYARGLGSAGRADAWVEKTPNHLRLVPQLREAFGPSTRFLCMVRDPRDVAASQFSRWKRGGALHVRTFAARWAFSDLLARRFEESIPGFRTLRYEDLVARPEESMRGAADHLGIPWDSCLLDPTVLGAPWIGNASSRRRALTDGESRLLERLLAPRMRARGYAPREPGADGPSAARGWIELVARFRALREVRPLPRPPAPTGAAAGPARPAARLPAG
jgi:sulfotransferase family protein